ncbi:hypothetical protein [Lederbergia citrea]|uniref:DUF4064 domain-containing protein n=1 Tax=Lederbergia citrea TaxID=2833581 RepID=A0A942URV7_9BACI|nr:hypothetical protein [Lederbergia citrea]MBS4221829.1 hypothetical protein [Lederbergia citrea]
MKVWVAVLAVLGGISGLVSGFLVTAGGSLFGDDAMASDGSAVFWLSALAIFLGFTAWKWNKISGIALIIISVVGFFMNGLFFTLAFIFLLIAGILSMRLKKRQSKEIIV